jgi:hypothetical protein
VADKSIRDPSQPISDMNPYWDMAEALMTGTQAMRAGSTKWLPRWPKEDDDSYQARLNTAVLHPAFKRTVLVNAARPLSKDMVIGEETPTRIQEWLPDIDQQGTTLAAFCVQLMGRLLSKGATGVLVEFPRTSATKTQAQEKAANVRPYCVEYPPGTVLGWRTAVVNGVTCLTQLRLLEQVEVADGDYGTKSVEQVRLLEPGKWSVYQQNPRNKDLWDEIDAGTTSIEFIPFVFFYGIRSGFGLGISPLADLAFQNVEHWQSASDQQTILHVARVPILFLRLFGEKSTLAIGANAALQAEDKDADAKYVEHSGAAIEAGKDSLIDLQDRMRSSGAELISLLPAYTTATQVSADGEANKSLLQQIVEMFEESIEQMLNFMAAWVKEPETAEVELFKDYSAMSDSDPTTLGSARKDGVISRETAFEELQRRDVISPDRTWEDEQKRLQADKSDDLAHQAKQNELTEPAP